MGAALSLAGGVVLIASATSTLSRIVYLIYTLGVTGLFLASATYHSVAPESKHEKLLQKFDHSAIYLMIMSCYLPVAALILPRAWGAPMVAAQLVFALTGIILTFKLKKVPGLVRVILYLSMGWMAVIALGPLNQNLSSTGVAWLFAGGIVYTIGAVIYVTDRPHLIPGKFSAHDLWHIFVLAGAGCHYVLNWQYVLPVAH